MKPFWIILLQDPATGDIHGTAHGHNATADYRGNPYYIGTQKIQVDMEKLKLGTKQSGGMEDK